MTLLGDLSTQTWLLSVAAMATCAFIIGKGIYNLRLKLPIRSRRARFVLFGLAFFCGGGVYSTISDASDAQHITVSGPLTPIREIYLGHNRYWYLAYVIGSNGLSEELNFGDEGKRVIAEHSRSITYKVGYLDEPEEYYKKGKQLFWYKVVDLSNAETGESYYHFDTRHHPIRAAIYFGDTILLILTIILVGRFADASPDTEDDYENYREAGSEASVGSSLTSLDLNSSSDQRS